jgi:invasion protein IalB
MKCIGDKCKKYFFSDHKAWCMLDDTYKKDNDICNIQEAIVNTEDKLMLLEQLKRNITKSQ